MEFDINIKAVLLSMQEYCSSQTDTSTSQLLRHLEVLSANLKTTQVESIFNRTNNLATECLSGFIEILGNYHSNGEVIKALVNILLYLAKNNNVLDYLCSSTNLVSPLTSYVTKYSNSTNCPTTEKLKQAVPLCLDLLDKVTYDKTIRLDAADHEAFIAFLLDEMKNLSGDLSYVCGSVLSNLVMKSIETQAQLKGMVNRATIRHLMQILKKPDEPTKINFLAIMAYAFWDDDLTAKLFSIQNIQQVLKLLFCNLYRTDTISFNKAADLIIELHKHENVVAHIKVYIQEHNLTRKIITAVKKNQLDKCYIAKVFEVFLCLSQNNLVRSNMAQQVFGCSNTLSIIMECIASPITALDMKSSLLALDFLRELTEESLDSSNPTELPWLHTVLAITIKQLVPTTQDDDKTPHLADAILKSAMSKTLKALQLMSSLANEDQLQQTVSSTAVEPLTHVIQYQLTNNQIALTSSKLPDWSDIGVDVVMVSLDLLMKLKLVSSNMDKLLYSTLQDPRIVPFIATAIASYDRKRVQIGLKLYQETAPLPDFPNLLLSEKIGNINRRRMEGSNEVRDHIMFDQQAPIKTDIKREFLSPTSSVGSGNSIRVMNINHDDNKENIQTLIEQVRGDSIRQKSTIGDDVSKNVSTTELMDIYEHKISSLVTKENQLEDLLEAKTLALQQADRLLTQYRCQKSRTEDDARRLGEMVRDSEKRCENYLASLRTCQSDNENLSREITEMVEEIGNLKKLAEQYEAMQSAYQDSSHKNDVLQRNLKASKQEFDTLKELHEMIQKHNDKLKNQERKSIVQIEELETERISLLKQQTALETKINNLMQLNEAQEKEAKDAMKEKAELESHCKKLQNRIAVQDETIKELKIKEHQLKERNVELKKLNSKMDTLYKKVKELESSNEKKSNDIKRLKAKATQQADALRMITQLGMEQDDIVGSSQS